METSRESCDRQTLQSTDIMGKDPTRVFPTYERHVKANIQKIEGFMTKHAGVTVGFSLRKLETPGILQMDLMAQLTHMETAWDEMRRTIDWNKEGIDTVYDSTE